MISLKMHCASYFWILKCLLLALINSWISFTEQTPSSVNRESKDFQIVYPEKLNAGGIRNRPHDHFHENLGYFRTSRGIYKINAFGKELIINLYKDSNFLAPSFHIEHHTEDRIERTSYSNEVQNCFYRGKVLNDTDSVVAINACAGLHGIIQTSFGQFYIEPQNKELDEGPLESVAKRKHVLTKIRKPEDRDNSSSTACEVAGGAEQRRRVNHGYQLKVNATGHVDAVRERHRGRRSTSWARYVETMVVADESMFDHYGAKELTLRRYILSVMAIVTSIFRDSSVGNYIDISVVKLVIMKKNPKSLNVKRSAAKALKSFCEWQKKRNKKSDKDPEHFDTAILLTRSDLCSSSRKCDTLGLAELGTICNPYRSCSIVEDNGLSVGFTIAHELGHLFDSPHDGDHNTCNKKNGKVHIMTPSFSLDSKTWSWSSCSKKYITDFLESGQGHCLFDKPSPKTEYHLSHKLPGEVFSADAQCKLMYGANSTVCPFIKTCSRLWCTKIHGKKRACQTNNMPWVDGTKCGEKQWCIRGECVVRKELLVVNGRWGKWRPYGPCSRTCGGGIQYSYRECDSPSPRNGGRYCLGLRRKYRSCNAQECKLGPDHFRASQCAAYDGKDLGIPGVSRSVHWKPKYAGVRKSDVCRLFCEVRGFNIYYELAPRVIDGTPCRRGSFDICVEGKCRPAGCDHVLNSESKLDKCGVCNGDNSSCRTYSGIKNTTRYGYNFVVHVPIGASNVRVTQYSLAKNAADTNFLAVISSRGRYIFNGNFVVSLGRKKYSDYGQNIYYSGSDAKDESVWIPGRITRPLIVHVLSVGQLMPANIKYTFNVPVRGKQNYSWVLDKDFGDCNFVCQGFQQRIYRCLRELDSQQVADDKCKTEKPNPIMRKCNRHCKMTWSVKIESECSVPCGKGFRYQSVHCVKKYGNLSQHDEVVSSKFCKYKPKPPKRVSCISECSNTRWVYTEWSKCSKNCGRGIQRREARCVDHKMRRLPGKECSYKALGPLKRRCNNIGCPQWKIGEWSLCTVTCGKGVQHREVYCVTGLNKRTKPSVCDPKTRPMATQPCELRSCPSWHFGAWTRCSVNCGIGFQTRKVGCRRADGELVSDNECNIAKRPVDRIECSGGQCPVIAHAAQEVNEDGARAIWMTGAWTECSRTCGAGFKERYVSCRYMNGEEAPVHICGADKKPAPFANCTLGPCPLWQAGEWSECTELCGGGTQTRQVYCGFRDESKVDEHFCDHSEKPAEKQGCNTQICTTEQPTSKVTTSASTGKWTVSQWGPCSVTCGTGLRVRRVQCASNQNKSCILSDKPISTTMCKAGPCPGWNYGNWSECSVTCGQGQKRRNVWCEFKNGTIATSVSCNQTFRPAPQQTCKLGPCPEVARWSVGLWQPCSVTCGNGFQFREIVCENGRGNQLPEASCAIKKKPSNQQPCNSHPCPRWIAGNWSECDSSCTQYRNISCVSGMKVLEEEVCSLESRPLQTRECASKNCVEVPAFSWKVGRWGACSKTCGYSVRSRNITCEDSRGYSVPLFHCNATSRMPKTLEACFGGQCVPKWISGPWSECSASCGAGVQRREVYCEGMLNQRLFKGGCSSSRKPTAWQMCNLGECRNTYHWKTGNWSKCSARCGIGVTMRKITCVDSNGKEQDEPFCKQKKLPNMKVCNLKPCPPTSCRSVQKRLGIHYDGEHYLLVNQRNYIKVYCAGMDTIKPKEYITLRVDPKENFSEIYGKRLRNRRICPNNGTRQRSCEDCLDYSASGTTFFSKVRVNLKQMVIIADDRKFAVKFGRNPPPFATAGDCFSQERCPQGRFRVNLKGTGLRIAPSVHWKSRGYYSSQDIVRKLDGELVYGKCGGYCGMCSPSLTGLKIALAHR